MIKLYKNYTILYYALGIGGGMAILILIALLFPNVGTAAAIIFAAMYIVILAMIIQVKTLKKYSSMMEIMTKQCNSKLFIEECKKTIGAYKKPNKGINVTMQLNIAAGYIALGDTKSGIEIIENIDTTQARGKRSKAVAAFVKAIYQATAFCINNDADGAEMYLQQAQAAIASYKFTEAELARNNVTMGLTKARIAVIKGEYEEAEELFSEELDRSCTTLRKVHAHYYLGLIYEKTQREDDAKEAYEYAKKYGGDSLSGRLAAERLAFLC